MRTLLDRLYRLLLWIYPTEFRKHYGEELLWVYRAWSHDTYRQAGRGKFLWFWLNAVLDLSVAGFKERLAGVHPVRSLEARQLMQVSTLNGTLGFGKRIARLLDLEPGYGAMLVTGEPTRPMTEIVESLLLDGDPNEPETLLHFFLKTGDALLSSQIDEWRIHLREAERRTYLAMYTEPPASASERLLYLIYADPVLYQLVAAADSSDPLYAIVDLLALDCDIDELEITLRLLSHLTTNE